MTSKKITIQPLHGDQKNKWNNRNRFNILAIGRRYGKTTMLRWISGIRSSLFNKYTDYDKYYIGFFAPNYKHMLSTFAMLKNTLKPLIKSASLSKKKIELHNGCVIDFWHLESGDAGNGEKYNIVLIDEAGLCKDLMRQWQENILFTLADFKGEAWIVGTPKGKNDYYKLYELYKNDDNWAVHHGSSYDNPHVPKSEIDMMAKAVPPQIVDQEIHGKFINTVGAQFVIDRAKLERCFVLKQTSGYKVLGVDIATDGGGDVNALSKLAGSTLMEVEEVFTEDELIRKIVSPENDEYTKLHFDSGGVGGNFGNNFKGVSKMVTPFSFGGEVKRKKRNFVKGITNEEFFSNRSAQIWWGLRLAIENTCRYLDGENIDINQCFFINPDISNKLNFINELTQVVYDVDTKGRIKIDKAPGKNKSPNMADSLIVALTEKFKNGVVAI